MHRLLVDAGALESETPALPKEALRHLKVIRPKSGEPIELFDGHGAARTYRYEGAALHAVAAARHFPLPPPLTLFACVTKGSRWDWTIEKATELGVTRIVPVLSERTIVRLNADERAEKRERWLRIAEAAARQSDAVWLPEILPPVDFAESLELVKSTRCFVGALIQPEPVPLLRACQTATGDMPPAGAAIYVGPEGDFTPEELSSLMKLAIPTTFGDRILRAETAAIFALSVLRAAMQV